MTEGARTVLGTTTLLVVTGAIAAGGRKIYGVHGVDDDQLQSDPSGSRARSGSADRAAGNVALQCGGHARNEKRRVRSSMKLVLTDESIRGLPRREMERRGYRKECNGEP